jgi:hypothetical protein
VKWLRLLLRCFAAWFCAMRLAGSISTDILRQVFNPSDARNYFVTRRKAMSRSPSGLFSITPFTVLAPVTLLVFPTR